MDCTCSGERIALQSSSDFSMGNLSLAFDDDPPMIEDEVLNRLTKVYGLVTRRIGITVIEIGAKRFCRRCGRSDL